MDIHLFSGSGFSWRVTLACAVKGVPWTEQLLQPTPEDLKSPAFLKLSPRGKVPVIEDDGATLAESLAILAYLDAKQPEPPLFGTSPAETGEIWRKALDFDLYVSSRLVFDLILPLLTGVDDKDALSKTASWAHDEIARLEADIGERAWLVGDQLSAADLAIYPILEPTIRFTITPEPLEMGLGFDAFAERYPRLQAWRSRVQALPGYEDAYPAAWRRMDEAS